MAHYFDVVGDYKKPIGNEESYNQYYMSTYAYLLYLKEREEPSHRTQNTFEAESDTEPTAQ